MDAAGKALRRCAVSMDLLQPSTCWRLCVGISQLCCCCWALPPAFVAACVTLKAVTRFTSSVCGLRVMMMGAYGHQGTTLEERVWGAWMHPAVPT